MRRAVIISGVSPFLLKTAGTSHGVEQSVFNEIQEALVADRLAYMTS